jgi:hypothetical protein
MLCLNALVLENSCAQKLVPKGQSKIASLKMLAPTKKRSQTRAGGSSFLTFSVYCCVQKVIATKLNH